MNVTDHFEKLAGSYDLYKQKNRFYYTHLKQLLSRYIPPRSAVFEFGCATGELLAYLSPKSGYGYDISRNMVHLAKKRHPSPILTFSTRLPPTDLKFDYIFLSDVVEHLSEPEKELRRLAGYVKNSTKLVNTMANPLWEPVLLLAEKLNAKMPEGPHRRISFRELNRILTQSGLELEIHSRCLLLPILIPIVSPFVNRFLEPMLRPLAFIDYAVYRRSPHLKLEKSKPRHFEQ